VTLEVREIDCFYGTSHILHGLSLSVKQGALFAVLGRNGAGKSTLLKSIIGLNPPRNGQISYNDKDVTRLKSHVRARQGIAYVPQGREIIPDITAEENLHIALLGTGRKANGVPSFIFDYFPALRDLTGRKGGVLSGGQQQQLAIARALVQEPTLLLMDEPTEGLQPSVVEEIDAIIKRIPDERGCSVLLVEQNLDFVRDITQEFAILDTGRIVAQGKISELTDDLAHRHLSV
jgi:urea transport system ATP-binding protein